MEVTNALKKLRDDLKEWTTNNILSLKTYVDKNKFSGSYKDLTDKPNIPSIEGLATEDLVNNLNNDVVENINKINTELETKASTEFVNNMLSGLRLVQMTQSEYDALEVKDSNTLYIII